MKHYGVQDEWGYVRAVSDDPARLSVAREHLRTPKGMEHRPFLRPTKLRKNARIALVDLVQVAPGVYRRLAQ